MKKELGEVKLLRDEETGEYSLGLKSYDSRFAPPDEFCFGVEGSKVVESVLHLLSMDANAALSSGAEETKVPDES